jgi:predicted PolB exonuclease-like 3'-5' exonuclease
MHTVAIGIDIETIPGQSEWIREHIAETIKPPAQMKKQETIDKWILEEKPSAVDDRWRNTSFDGALGHVICIGACLDGEDPVTFYADTVDKEKEILEQLYSWIADNTYRRTATYYGHNIIGFDLKFLKKRSVILNVRPQVFIPFNAKKYSDNPYDTMLKWDDEYQKMVSLETLCKALQIPGKGEIDGSQIYDLWKSGEHVKIQEYCKGDVKRTRDVYKRMNFISDKEMVF